MWLILFAILLLCVLVFINKKKEGFTASHALDIYTILMDQTTDSDEKIKKLLTNIASVNDNTMEDIIKSDVLSNKEKILKIKQYFDSLIDKRNAKHYYRNQIRIIDFDTFFHILKIMQGNEFNEDDEKILEIKKLIPFDDAFDFVLNDSDKDKLVKKDEDPPPLSTIQKLQNLINEIIYTA